MAFQQFPTTISKKPCTVFAGIASEEKKLKQAPGSMPEDMRVEMPAMDAPAEVVGAKDWNSMEQTKQSYTQTSISHQPLMMIDAYTLYMLYSETLCHSSPWVCNSLASLLWISKLT